MTENTPRYETIYLEVLLGINKTDSVLQPLSDAESKQWDRLVIEVKDIKDKGYAFDIPNEIPFSEPVVMVDYGD